MSGRTRAYPLHEWLPRIDVHEPAEPPPPSAFGRADRETRGEAASLATVLVAGIGGIASLGADPTIAHLVRLGYRALGAAGADEAIELFAREDMALVIVDERLVAEGGSELVRRLRAARPSLPILLRSDGIAAPARRELLRALHLNGSYGCADDPDRVADLVDGVLALNRSLDRMRTEQEVRGLVLAKLCHNLRSPLHVIQGYTEMLREDAESDEVEELLARLAGATQTALGLIHDYLDVARTETPEPGAVRREKVGLDQLMVDLLGYAGREIGEQPLRLMTTIPFAGGTLYTDGDKLKEILRQLVANAIKFTPSGEIRLTVHSGSAATDFVLEDPGVGITERDAAALFTPFRQRVGEQVSHVPGQGVGLAIAERLSTLIGASLTAQPREQGGSVFTLRVPAPLIAQTSGPSPTLH